jgi:hypothetical protein
VNTLINFWAVITITVIYFILGALWYSKLLFGKTWAIVNNFNIDELKAEPKMFVGAAISAFITTLFLAILLEVIGTYDILIGLLTGLIVGIGFVIAIGFYDVIYEDKNIISYAVDAGYHVVALLIAGLILGLWQI